MARKRKTLMKLAGGVVVLGVAGFVVLTSPWTWALTHPDRTTPDAKGADIANGRQLFVAADCATCHMTQGQTDDTLLGGGKALDTQFGVFHMPNISPDPDNGIGKWTLAEFDRAMREGVGPGGMWPDGQNLYPAFPYTSYQHMSGNDVRDLFAYLKTLPPVKNKVADQDLKFPFNLRRGVGVWRLLFLDGQRDQTAKVPEGVDAAQFKRGEYLVEAVAHCSECHSPRGPIGNVLSDTRFSGGMSAAGAGYVPNITPDETGIGFWSQASIANYLHTGVSPIGRSSDGDMAEIIENTSKLPFKDLQAMALYLKHVPAVDNPAPGTPEPNRTAKVIMLKNVIKAKADLPEAPAAQIADGKTVTVVVAKTAWLDKDAVGGDTPEQGKVLGGAEVEVAKHDGDAVQLVLKGWQMADAPSVIYQARGKRVMSAVLGDAAAAKVERGPAKTDEGTGQSWMPVKITLWSSAKGMNPDRQAVWAYGQETFEKTCSACHVLPEKTHFTANQWIGTLKAMKRFTSYSPDQYRLVLAYLQNHSKDLNVETKEAAK